MSAEPDAASWLSPAGPDLVAVAASCRWTAEHLRTCPTCSARPDTTRGLLLVALVRALGNAMDAAGDPTPALVALVTGEAAGSPWPPTWPARHDAVAGLLLAARAVAEAEDAEAVADVLADMADVLEDVAGRALVEEAERLGEREP